MRDDYVNNEIDQKYIWISVLIPSIVILIGNLIGADLSILFPLAFVFIYLDRKELAKKGQENPPLVWILIFPVYLWKRATLLNGDKNYFWAFFAAPVLALMLGTLLSPTLESTAAELTTQILYENGMAGVECTSVSITGEPTNGVNFGTATLSDGGYAGIKIITNDEGDVYVEILKMF